MTHCEKLKNLLENEVVPDLEEAIDEMFAMIERDKTVSLADREELEQMQEMHKECKDILEEIALGQMDNDEAGELLEELIELKTE